MKEKKISKQRQKNGQALSEYLILIALVAVGSMGVVQILSKNIKTRFADVSDAIRGEAQNRSGAKIRPEQIEASDMGDFAQGIRNNE